MFEQAGSHNTLTDKTNPAQPTILVVDDDENFRVQICNILQPRGYKIVEARSPAHAEQLLSQLEPLLAIVD